MTRRVRALAAIAIAAAMLGIGTLGVAPASGQEPGPSQICDLFLEEAFEEFFRTDISHGACVALVAATNPVPLFASLCKSPVAIARIEAVFGVDVPDRNVGQCVNFLKENFREAVPPA